MGGSLSTRSVATLTPRIPSNEMADPTPRRTLKELLSAEERQWLVRGPNQQVLGPVPEVMLLKALVRGGIDESTLVHPVGQPQWRPVSSYPRLLNSSDRLRQQAASMRTERLRAAASQAQPREAPAQATNAPRSGVRGKGLSSSKRRRARAAGE
jgi:hypothetical protein